MQPTEAHDQSIEQVVKVRLENAPYFRRLIQNLVRVQVLITACETVQTSTGQNDGHQRLAADDMLRMTVVFIHATLEDFLRTLASILLQDADRNVLDEIPLVDLNRSGRAEKFTLGELARFRAKSVDQVIQASIMQYLDHSSFNQLEDITRLMSRLKLSELDYKTASFSTIGELIQRRHRIVHNADRQGVSEALDQPPQPINVKDVEEWYHATEDFILKVMPAVFAKGGAGIVNRFGLLTESEYDNSRYREDVGPVSGITDS